MAHHRTIAAFALIAATGAVQAQDHWAMRVGAWSNEAFNDVAIDAQGNLYAVGEFGGNIDLGGGTTLISQGSSDALVAKYNANGLLVWARTFGGPGLDRAIKVALTADGQLAVVGQFMLTADFDGLSATSQAGTQDMFVLKMAQSDGAVSWLRQAGSPDGVDQPNGVSVGPDGSIAVAGEFRGNAVFDQGTFTSIVDPDNGQPSVDIFLATYAADGTPLWVQQGAAEYADRGMDVVHDLDGNLYLTGQFSDTITFDQTHTNAMFSAIFITRFNAAGQEEWFRVFGGGTYNQVFEMLLIEGDRLMLVGDVQGTVIFQDTQPDLWTVVEPRSSFLVEVGLDGELLRQKSWGSDYTVNTRALSVQGDDILVLGRFTCQFTGFSDVYGEGTFIATGPNDLYVARFQLSDLVFKEAQQFGGQGDKVPGGIVHAADASPIFCGSYEHLLVFPSAGSFAAWPTWALQVPVVQPLPYCADAVYDGYAHLRGNALKDAFLARGYDDAREPYDVFDRTGSTCDRSLRHPVVIAGNEGVLGPDSIVRCYQTTLLAETYTAYIADTAYRHTAPDFSFLWSTGATTMSLPVFQSGWYWVTVSFGPGCMAYTDSIHVTLNLLPPSLLFNDDVVVNIAAHPPSPIEVCEPQHPWLWLTGQPAQNTITWYAPGAQPLVNDSIQATVSGNYVAVVTTPQGCTRYNSITVIIHPSGPLLPYDVDLITDFPQDLDNNDTIEVCENAMVVCETLAEIALAGQPVVLPPWVLMYGNCGNGWYEVPAEQFPCAEQATSEGWYVFNIGFMVTNAPCGDDSLFYYAADSIYVIPLEVSFPQVDIGGPALMCPGDTVAITGSCIGCNTTTWQGPSIVSFSADTAWIIGPGLYSFTGNVVDPNGCMANTGAQLDVEWNPQPLLAVDPLDGIICPNSTATIWSESGGLQYQWYGPLGPLTVNNDTIITSQQGFYYLDMVDSLGCLVTSDPILVTDYATPYLNVIPDNVLCEPGETAILQVVTTSTATLLWDAPFAGSNALQQTIMQPGVYTCHVSACGIVTTLSTEILGNTANAELVTPGPFTLCPGDEVTLEAEPGAVLYYWYPGPILANSITTDTSGVYLLVVTDGVGCQDSLFTEVIVLPEYEEIAFDVLDFCAGDSVTLVVSGDDLITWYADSVMTAVLGTGTSLFLGALSASTTVWVEQVVGSCSSGSLEVLVNVHQPPLPPVITGNATVCEGGVLDLSTPFYPDTWYLWMSPTGASYSTASVTIDPVTIAHDGLWYVQTSNAGCGGFVLPFTVEVVDAADMSIGPDTTICPGGMAQFEMPPGFSQPQWIGGSQAPLYSTGTAGPVWLTAADANGCAVSDTAMVIIYAFTQPLATTGSIICLGQSTTLFATGSGTFSWYADAGLTQLVHSGDSWFFSTPQDSAIYYVTQNDGICTSFAQPVLLGVTPVPADAQLIVPPACEGADIVLSLTGANDPMGSWTTPSGAYQGASITIYGLAQADAGLYTVVPFIGQCAGDTLSVMLDVLVPAPFDLGEDSVLCAGGSIVVTGPPGFSQFQWSTGSTASAITITEPGGYSVQAVDAQGCLVSDEIAFMLVECPDIIPNVVTPNGDGDNDVWVLGPGPWTAATLDIYNRWGQLVWQGDAMKVGFSGRHMDNGEPLSEGTYFYVLHLTRAGGTVDDLTGHITLLR